MNSSINTRKVGGTIIIDISGTLTMGEPALKLRETIARSVAAGDAKFIINLAEVSYVDSSGIGELVTTYTTARKVQGDLKLLKLNARVKDLLQMTKLLAVFDTYDDEQKAVAAISGAAARG